MTTEDRAGGATAVRTLLNVTRPGPLTALGAFVLVMVAALALREVASLIVPVVFGLFLALVAFPMVRALERRGLRHGLALTAAILTVLVIVLGAGGIIALSVAELVIQIPGYEDRLRAQIEALQQFLVSLGIEIDAEALPTIISPEQLVALVRPVASALSSAGAAVFILALTIIYGLAGASSLQERARVAFGERHGMLTGIQRFGGELRRYLVVRALLGAFAAALALVLLLALGVPFAILWAFLVFFASFVPNVGTFIAVIPPTIMAFLDGGVGIAVVVVIGYTLINVAQDQFLQPVVMGSELNLTPLVVFLSVILWAWILGAAGALLAVPLTVGFVALLEASPSTSGIAALLRNRVDAPPGLISEPEAQKLEADEAGGTSA
jgi:AI-2 transport protein TqsA